MAAELEGARTPGLPGTVAALDAEAQRFRCEVQIVGLLVSPIHRYEGRPGDGPLPVPVDSPAEVRESVQVRAGLGVVGDRYFGREAHRRASVTLMAVESVEAVRRELGLENELDIFATRRNIMLRGADVDALVGQPFAIEQGGVTVEFQVHRAANPCAWMNVTLAEGAHKALRGRGGVRTEPLSDGVLSLGPATLLSAVDVETRLLRSAPPV